MTVAETPETIVITNDPLAKELADIGKRLIELSMAIRNGMTVNVHPALTVEAEEE